MGGARKLQAASPAGYQPVTYPVQPGGPYVMQWAAGGTSTMAWIDFVLASFRVFRVQNGSEKPMRSGKMRNDVKEKMDLEDV